MSNELVKQLPPQAFYRESAVGYNPWANAVQATSLVGLRLNKLTIDGYNAVFQIPANLTMGTGLTFSMLVLPSAEFASDLGLAVVLGLTVKRLISGETPDLGVAAATEQTVTVTLQSTANQVTLATLAIANANLDSAVVGDHIAVRLRRISTNAADTAQGSVAYVGGSVKNT